MTRLLAPLGLRSRLTLSFGASFLALSGGLSLLAYQFTRTYLVDQRESAAVRQTVSDARIVSVGVLSADADIPVLLDSLGSRSGSQALVYLGDQIFASSLATSPSSIPVTLLSGLQDEQVLKQRFVVEGEPRLAVGTRLEGGVRYVEVFPLSELDRALRVLSYALLAAASIMTVVGTGLGFAVSRRVLRPVTHAADAAALLAQGALDTRLEAGQDRDLATLAASFNSMATALQARIQRDAAFAADVSHELRSPLTTLVAAVSVLQREDRPLSGPERQAVDLIAAELGRFQRLVEDLIEIARADAGAPLDLEQVDLRVLALESIRRSPYAGVQVEVEEGREEFSVLGDKLRLERVLHNLLENASRYAGGAVCVRLSSDAEGIRVEVDDAGPGIPPDQRERVFERFARGPDASSAAARGSGIGLALVREHVRMHGGQVWVEERPGGGSRFVVELPGVSG